MCSVQWTCIECTLCAKLFVCLFPVRGSSPVHVCVLAKSLQSCPTLCDPLDCSPPAKLFSPWDSPGILEWLAMPSSRGSSWPRDWTLVSGICLHWQAGSLPLVPPGKPQSPIGACITCRQKLWDNAANIYINRQMHKAWMPCRWLFLFRVSKRVGCGPVLKGILRKWILRVNLKSSGLERSHRNWGKTEFHRYRRQ